MRISKASRIFKTNDPGWYLLTEISLCEFLSNHDQSHADKAGILSQIAQETGIPTEFAERIAKVATTLAKEAPAHFQQGGVENPVQMRIFCQKKIIGEANLVQITPRSVFAEKPAESARKDPEAGTVMSNGWGYFILERAADNANSTDTSYPIIDVYFYKEGN